MHTQSFELFISAWFRGYKSYKLQKQRHKSIYLQLNLQFTELTLNKLSHFWNFQFELL